MNPHRADDREVLLRLLHLVLIDIRATAYETGNSKIFHLADCVHNAPSALATTWRSGQEPDFSEILKDVERRFIDKGSNRFSALKALIEART